MISGALGTGVRISDTLLRAPRLSRGTRLGHSEVVHLDFQMMVDAEAVDAVRGGESRSRRREHGRTVVGSAE